MNIRQQFAARVSSLRRLSRRARIISVAALALVAVLAAIYFWRDVSNTFRTTSVRLAGANQVHVESADLAPLNRPGVKLLLNYSTVCGVAELNGKRYAASDGGLIQLRDDGGVDKVFTVLDGLPENELTAIAVYQNKLYLGTRHEGLLAFNGTRFTHFKLSIFKDKSIPITNITALLPTEAELLIGTANNHLLEFDGQNFTQRYSQVKGADFAAITSLWKQDSRLYIGTQAQGLYVWREGRIDHLTKHDGLPSDRVTAITRHDARIIAATDFGVVEIADNNQVIPLNSTPNVSSIIDFDGRLYAGVFTGGVAELSTSASSGRARIIQVSDTAGGGHADVSDVRLQADDGGLWASGKGGVYRWSGSSFKPFLAPVANAQLSSGHVTSLAFDWAGRLWVGYFDGGVDVLSSETHDRFTHLEDSGLREVNFLRADNERGKMMVATSAGLYSFDTRLQPRRFTQADGLIGDAVSHITVASGLAFQNSPTAGFDTSVVLATGKGLTVIPVTTKSAGSVAPRSLSVFNGLASNYIYTTLDIGGRLFVGTLGGLTELERMRVTRTYSAANSKLAANWVTALANVDGTLFIGTNGGGVQALTPVGEWLDFKDEIGRFDVNLNAMLFDGRRLFVGTLDRGVKVFDTRSRQWSEFTTGLSSKNVTAIAADSEHLYFGTTNGITQVERRLFE